MEAVNEDHRGARLGNTELVDHLSDRRPIGTLHGRLVALGAFRQVLR
ncbi:hypothetical protein [Candidatus Methylomirabilis sp.]|nr:hypothetical protein [Candidatus Methylomirabilis sp.]